MARPLRIEFPGRVVPRHESWGRAAVRFSPEDGQRRYFLALLAGAAERFNAEWHAYCLMGNHYHLLLRTPEGNLQRIMRHINGVYTQYYNRATGRDGPLFRGRYKAVLVDAEAYWTQLSRYIHRNPLEAGLVEDLSEYPWSSYPAYIGRATKPDWLICDYVLLAIAQRNARTRYRAYVESVTEDEITCFYADGRHSPILGDDTFQTSASPRAADDRCSATSCGPPQAARGGDRVRSGAVPRS